MAKDSGVSRVDILTLNLQDIKKSLPSVPQTKLVVSKSNVDSLPLTQNVVKTYTYSSSNQICVSRNKLGRQLLQHCRRGFNLNDPHIYQSRFYVDYHRLHDPALKKYHNSVPVKDRLAELQMISKQNDVICTQKEFADYLRYIDTNLIYKETEMKRREEARKLSDYYRRLTETKIRGSKYVGTLRKEKIKREPKSMAYLDKEKKLKIRLQSKKVNDAIERAAKIKDDTSTFLKFINVAKEEQYKRRMQTELQAEQERKIEMNKNLDEKLKQAQKRRESLKKEKRIFKMKGEIDHFMKHSAIRQEVLLRNIKLFELHKQEQQANTEARIKKNERLQERNESEEIKLRKSILKKEENADIIDKIMKNIEQLSDEYMKTVDPADFEEVSRRFSMLTRPFVIENLERVKKGFRALDLQAPSALLAARTIKMMGLRVLIIPEIGNSKCEFIQQKIAEIISKTIIEIQKHFESIIRENRIHLHQEEKKTVHNVNHHVVLIESKVTIGQSPYTEFFEAPNVSLVEGYYDLNTEIRRELKEMFEVITRCQFEFSDMFKTRDFIHLYDFQKFIIHKCIGRIIELIEMKLNHYWPKKNIPSWQALDLNLDNISFEAADSVMRFPHNTDKIVIWLQKICKLICVKVDANLKQETQIRTSESVTNEL